VKKKIPQIIHYCWFGKNKKNRLIQKCIASWSEFLPDYEIKLWDENNLDIESHPYTRLKYKEKHWTFVSDYVRFYALHKEGGIYLDTDMQVLKNLDVFLRNECFVGFEAKRINGVSAGIIGVEKNHWFPKECLGYFDRMEKIDSGPHVINMVLQNHGGVKKYGEQKIEGIRIYPIEYFYPFAHREKFVKDCIKSNTYTIHWYVASWIKPRYKRIAISIYKKAEELWLFIKSIFPKIKK